GGISLLAVETLLRDAVEEGEETVVILLRQRIELVVVALAAAQRQAQKCGGRRVDPVVDVDGRVLLRDRAAFEINRMVAVETGGDLLVRRRGALWARKQVA